MPLAGLTGKSHVDVVRDRVGVATLERQRALLGSMGTVLYEYSPRGGLERIIGSTGIYLAHGGSTLKAGDDGQEILAKLGGALLAKGTEELRVVSVRTDSTPNQRVIKLEEFIRGVPVLHGGVNLGVEPATGEITTVSATFLSDYGLPTVPKLSDGDAKRQVLHVLTAAADPDTEILVSDVPSELAYAHGPPGSRGQVDNPGHLVWVVSVTERRAQAQFFSKEGWVDAMTGEVLGFVHTSLYASAAEPESD